MVSELGDGDAHGLDDEQAGLLARVAAYYGRLDGKSLSDLTHRENPWREARDGLPPGARGSSVIEQSALEQFYTADRAPFVWP